MKLLVLAAAAALATFATLGWMGYRLLAPDRLPPSGVPAGLISSQQLPPEEGQAVADAIMTLTLPDLAGRSQAIAQWRGKVLVVNYWASWCAPCIEEMPAFSRLQARYAAQGVQFVGIGLDDLARMQAFVARTPVTYPLLAGDPAGSQQSGLRVKGLPYTVVIDRTGRFDSSRLGRLDEATLIPVLERLIAP